MYRVAFLGRGKLGMNVLQGLLKNKEVKVIIIIACAATAEVQFTEEDFKKVANENDIEFHATNNINTERYRAIFESHAIDLAVAMLWLYTIEEPIISTVRLGIINLHGGQLPYYRGNACQTWAIINAEKQIGVTCHLMKAGELDSGPIVRQLLIDVAPDSMVGDLIAQAEEIGSELVLQSVIDVLSGQCDTVEQDNNVASYCYPRLPRDGEIDWNCSAILIERLVRAAGRPYLGAYTWYSDVRDKGVIKKLVILSAHVEQHPLKEYYAVPGHLLKLKSGEKWGVACGDKHILVLDEITIDGAPVQISLAFCTVRQRFGLDISSEVAKINSRLAQLEKSLASVLISTAK